MSSQIFKNVYPKQSLINFIDKFAHNNNNNNNNINYYLINKSYYKRAVFLDIIKYFIDDIKDYYHVSKYKYIENVDNYSKFMTIIRQLCKINNINYASKIIYSKSTYDITYYIYP
jgi:hypothetical protein